MEKKKLTLSEEISNLRNKDYFCMLLHSQCELDSAPFIKWIITKVEAGYIYTEPTKKSHSIFVPNIELKEEE